MSESSTGTGGDESRPITDQPLPNDDDWEDAPSEGETEVKSAFCLHLRRITGTGCSTASWCGPWPSWLSAPLREGWCWPV